MTDHRSGLWHAVLGLAYACLGVVLAGQEVLGPLAVRWEVVLPGLLVAIGLLVVGSAAVGDRRHSR